MDAGKEKLHSVIITLETNSYISFIVITQEATQVVLISCLQIKMKFVVVGLSK